MRRETVPHEGQALKLLAGRTVMTVLSKSQNALSTTNSDGTRLERRSACCMALIPSKTAPRDSETSSKLSQSQNWTPIRGQIWAPIDSGARPISLASHSETQKPDATRQ